ncbi:lipid II-degrading bacteriocin [Burkholderia multivorans]|uniref:lipid II-degrading bacteriocin n=1 Tax=Burkholderia multivorans TaxID=87883 RepID=UPI00209CFBEE|nr:lipid II-degrading bacteriocin [Burkholderia multivorans]MCO8614085.1 lipid II-degrading bacteriocin [Burkholderia multivorans]MCO8641101.1 lipid II-degrading bacteriocin [Burkholderia multivorans]
MTEKRNSLPEIYRMFNDAHARKRRKLLGISIAAPATMTLRPLRGWAQGHGPANDMMPSINITASHDYSLPVATPNGPAGGYVWAPGMEAVRGGIWQIGQFRLVNGRKIFQAAAAKNPLELLRQFAYGIELASNNVIRAQIATYGLFTQWLANNGWQSIVGANQYELSNMQIGGLSTAFGIFSNYYFSHLPAPPISDFKFYATPFFPLAAYDYWLRGDGSPRSVDLRSLHLKIGAAEIGPIRNIIINDGMGPGIYPIDAVFSTNLLSDHEYIVGSALGRVSGHVTGQLTLSADGFFRFNGEYTLNPDKFDFDASKSRPPVQEALTTLIRVIGSFTGYHDYMIYFTGSQPLNVEGTRASIKATNADGGAVHIPSIGHGRIRSAIN